MQLIRKNQTQWRANSNTCFVHDYPTNCTDMNGAVIEIGDRYPDVRRVYNTVCTMMAYVLRSRDGRIVVEGAEHPLSTGDLIRIEPHERYYWEGNLHLFVASIPAWTPEQHKQEEDA